MTNQKKEVTKEDAQELLLLWLLKNPSELQKLHSDPLTFVSRKNKNIDLFIFQKKLGRYRSNISSRSSPAEFGAECSDQQ